MASNGQIPLNQLAQVGYNVNGDMQYLEPTAARYWTALVIKATSTGTIGLNCLEGYRSLDEQWRLYNGYQAGIPGFNSAAYPGTSPHGFGLAVDVYNMGGFLSAKYAWMKANAPAYGYTNTVGIQIDEPWHWVFGSPTIPAGNLGVSIPGTTQGDEEVAKPRLFKPNAGVAVGKGISIAPGMISSSAGPGYDAIWQAECGPFLPCSADEMNVLCTLYGIPWDKLAFVANNPGSVWNA